MANLERGFRRLTWVVSLVLSVPTATLGLFFMTAGEHDQTLGYLFLFGGLGIFAVSWLIFFAARWIATGFGDRRATRSREESASQIATTDSIGASKACPRCGAQNTPGALHCGCGYDFAETRVADPQEPSKTNWLWPRLTDSATARKAAREGVFAAAWIALVTASIATSNVFFGTTFMQITSAAYVDALLFALIGFGIYKMSRVAAIAGLALYAYEAVYMNATRGTTPNIIMLLVLTLAFANGIRGTFAASRFAKSQSVGPSVSTHSPSV